MDRKKILLGIKLFIAISLVTQLGIFIYTSRQDVTVSFSEMVSKFNYAMLAVAVGLSWMEGFISGFRNFMIMRIINRRIRYLTSVKAAYGNIYLGATTPSQTGGGIAQIYFITRDGIPISHATSGALLTFICTLLFLTPCLIIVSIFVPDTLAENFRIMTKSAAVTIASFSSLFFLSVIFPRPIGSALKGLLNRLKRIGLIKDRNGKAEARVKRVGDGLVTYRESVLIMLKDGKLAFLVGLVCTCLFFANRFIIPYFVLRGLGIEADVVEVIYIQLLITLINYFSPTPGASGLAEVSSIVLMGPLVESIFVPLYTVLWRICTLYVNVTIGGVLLYRELGKKLNNEFLLK